MPFKNGNVPKNKGIFNHKSMDRKFYYYRNILANSQFRKFQQMIKNLTVVEILERDNMLNGLLLSDAHLRRPKNYNNNSNFMLLQTETHEELITNCEKHLNDLGFNTYKYKKFQKKYNTFHIGLDSSKSIIFSELRRYWYPNGIKIVPKDIQLTPKTIAYWFMGDGTSWWSINDTCTIKFCTQGFDLNSILILQNKLKRLKIDSRLEKVQLQNRVSYSIVIGKSIHILRLLNLIEPYILKSFNYKIKKPKLTSHAISNKEIRRGFCK